MPPQKRPPCQICGTNESKYTCSKCLIVYCSVSCYKQHKERSCSSPANAGAEQANITPLGPREQPAENTETALTDGTLPFTAPAHALSTLPSSSTPLAEAQPQNGTATDTPSESENEPRSSTQVTAEPSAPLRPLTSLRWPYIPEESAYPDPLKRDDPKHLQLHQYEAIATSPAVRQTLATHPRLPALLRSLDALRGEERQDALQRALGVSAADLASHAHASSSRQPVKEDVLALRALAEAIEAAVRGGKEDALGLDWEG